MSERPDNLDRIMALETQVRQQQKVIADLRYDADRFQIALANECVRTKQLLDLVLAYHEEDNIRRINELNHKRG